MARQTCIIRGVAKLTKTEPLFITVPSAAGEAELPAAVGRDGYKRPFDLAVLLLAHLLLLPLWVLFWTLIPLVIKLSDGGPVFYTHARVGRHGQVFRIIKFRTMIVGAENATGPVWAAEEDQRVTKVGCLLRRTHLDEMPQVLNVLRGEMSLVGPRPERPELTEQFCRETPGFHRRLRVRPGIGGLAQVRGKYDTQPRHKLRYDNLYIANLSPGLDLKLLVQSVWVAFRNGQY